MTEEGPAVDYWPVIEEAERTLAARRYRVARKVEITLAVVGSAVALGGIGLAVANTGNRDYQPAVPVGQQP